MKPPKKADEKGSPSLIGKTRDKETLPLKNPNQYGDGLDKLEQELIELETGDIEDYFEDYDEDKYGLERVQIFGTDGTTILPILTDSEGRLKISVDINYNIPASYKEVVIKNLSTINNFKFTQAFDISMNIRTSFIISNLSSANAVIIQLQDSPNGSFYQIDLPEIIVEPKSFKIITPTRFIRYQRIAYRSTNSNKSADIEIFYQAQTYVTG